MPNGDKPGDAAAEKWAERFEKLRREEELSLTRLDVRADMKSFGEEEISEVIDQRVLEAQRKKESDPPSSKASPLVIVHTVVKRLKGWPLVAVVIAGILAVLRWYGKL